MRPATVRLRLAERMTLTGISELLDITVNIILRPFPLRGRLKFKRGYDIMTVDISERARYFLSTDIGIFLRDETHIQFGLDSTRAGIIESHNAETLVEILRAGQHEGARTRYQWERAFAAGGMSMLAARSLLHDLVEYRIMHLETAPPRVVILGDSPLAQSIRKMCFDRGLGVRSPLDWEALGVYLSTMEDDTVVLAVDQLYRTPKVAAALHSLPETCSWMPISLVDSRGFIGPLHLKGKGPCPLCFELHRAAFDPRWAVITEQLEETIIAPNDQVLAAVTAQAAVIIDWLTGRPFPPGAPHKRFYAGELFDIDIYGKSQHQLVGAHAQCPACFQA